MAFSPLSHEHGKGLLTQWTVLKVDLLQDHQIHCLEACMCALFSPEIVQAVVLGVNMTRLLMLKTFVLRCQLPGMHNHAWAAWHQW